jgi:hypothetical protein
MRCMCTHVYPCSGGTATLLPPKLIRSLLKLTEHLKYGSSQEKRQRQRAPVCTGGHAAPEARETRRASYPAPQPRADRRYSPSAHSVQEGALPETGRAKRDLLPRPSCNHPHAIPEHLAFGDLNSHETRAGARARDPPGLRRARATQPVACRVMTRRLRSNLPRGGIPLASPSGRCRATSPLELDRAWQPLISKWRSAHTCFHSSFQSIQALRRLTLC